MTYIIAQPCEGTCNTSCVDVCPVDCIHGPFDRTGAGKEVKTLEKLDGLQLYINPEECIDCGACEHVCPPGAIFHEDEVPVEWKHYIKKNADFFKEEEE
ncbi:ferredoxin [candidate division KSB1 bacterium RBG_16_48_16]|nr:MAG: ferredoxin [candidate division KSB1 bacterium RBG_16_48_16]